MAETKRDLVFLSYAHDDLEKVWGVYEGLKKRKVNIWFDKEDLEPGRWKTKIEKQIPKCRYFIFCVSEASIKKTAAGTGFVEEELQTAWKIADAQDEKKFTIIPVRLEECGHGDHRLSIFQEYVLFEDIEKGLDKLAVKIGGISLADAKAKDKRTEDEKFLDTLAGKADVAFYSGEYNKALSLFDAIINIDIENQAAWSNKGIALIHSGKYEAAIAARDKAMGLKPDLANSLNKKGIAFLLSGKYEAAIAACDKAIEFKPDFPEAWYNKGIALHCLKQYEAAIAAYDKAIELDPNDHLAWSNKGLALEKSGEYEAAIAAYNKAIELKSDDEDAWHKKGVALEKLGRNEEAKQAFKKVEELKKKSQEWKK